MRAYLNDRNLRRGFVLALFVGLLAYFRHLFLLFVFFVVFERIFGTLARYIQAITKRSFRFGVLGAVLLVVGGVGLAVLFGVHTLVGRVPHIRHGLDALI